MAVLTGISLRPLEVLPGIHYAPNGLACLVLPTTLTVTLNIAYSMTSLPVMAIPLMIFLIFTTSMTVESYLLSTPDELVFCCLYSGQTVRRMHCRQKREVLSASRNKIKTKFVFEFCCMNSFCSGYVCVSTKR
jgi:hypothetical protein